MKNLWSYLNDRKAELETTSENSDNAFTVVELLVVILIIGILAGIAIPAFLNQREVANDKAVESDLRNSAISMETNGILNSGNPIAPGFTVSNFNVPTLVSNIVAAPANFDVQVSPNVVLTVVSDDGMGGYCITGTNENSKSYKDGKVGTYDSLAGGLNKQGGACPESLNLGKPADGTDADTGAVVASGEEFLGVETRVIGVASHKGLPIGYSQAYFVNTYWETTNASIEDEQRLQDTAMISFPDLNVYDVKGTVFHDQDREGHSEYPGEGNLSQGFITFEYTMTQEWVGEHGSTRVEVPGIFSYVDSNGKTQTYDISVPVTASYGGM